MCVTRGGGWVRLWRSCLLGELALGPPRRCSFRSTAACTLPGPPRRSYKAICFVLGLEMPGKGQAVKEALCPFLPLLSFGICTYPVWSLLSFLNL